MPQPFYRRRGGLRFECTQCGLCCTRPGPVYFSLDEIRSAAKHLGLSIRAFRGRYRLRDEDGHGVVDPGGEAPCPLHDEEKGCTIYPARPVQCRTWPFWPEVVRRRRSWERAARECEGMNHGPRHGPAAIEKELARSHQAGVPEGEPW